MWFSGGVLRRRLPWSGAAAPVFLTRRRVPSVRPWLVVAAVLVAIGGPVVAAGVLRGESVPATPHVSRVEGTAQGPAVVSPAGRVRPGQRLDVAAHAWRPGPTFA